MFLGVRAIRLSAGRALRTSLPLGESTLFVSASSIRDSTIQRNPLYQQYQRLSTASSVKLLEDEKGDNQSPEETSNNTSSSVKDSLPAWLRPYQVQVILECMKALDGGLQRIGVSSPTGSGKTVMFTHLIPLLLERGSFQGGSVLVLVGNIELARQAYKTIKSSFPDYAVELEQGASTASGSADVTIATYQTLRQDSRLAKFDPERFKGIIVDEAHHAAAPSYIKLLSYFNADVKSSDKTNPAPYPAQADQPNVPIIGFTATFSRHDQLALSRVFQEIVYHQDVIDMLEAGWLSPARFTTVRVDLKLSKVSVSSSTDDYSATSLAEVMNTPAMNDLIVRVYLDRAGDRKSTLIFCVDLQHVADMTAAFRHAGVDARFVTGNTKESQRKSLVEAFKAGEFPVMVNCQLFTEGTDIPNIDCIIVARPTRSRNLFSQMIGRGLRHSPGKEDCRIIDLADNVKKVGGLITGPTLFGLDADAAVDDATVGTLKKWAREREELEEQGSEDGLDEQVSGDVSYQEDDDPFRLDDPSSKSARVKSKYAWVSCGDSKYVLDAFESEYYSIVRENGLFQIRHTYQLPKEMAREGKKFSPFRKPTIHGRTETLEAAFRAGDALVEKMIPRPRRSNLTRWAFWRRKPASPAQLKWLGKRVEKGSASGTTITVKPDRDEDNHDEPLQLTCGQVTAMLTAMKHGAKGRYEKSSRKNEQAQKVKAKEARRQAAQTVKVGPLGH
ncbi:hypothetical protein QFC21_006762 [Naganishia friedmannii]|uniref:Uncharacterized protein n=1 Tax=Naganishia friedmannii TaxID=89922 RepID=A0ACC2V1I8_9TREE|nr:hypothetical protein QFC21_006762 [Naganishia friedmannii]